ncbi:MAG: pyridoxal phosphate-dependent aminotransferase, partial [Clostridia bacterium]|nr:pyridoxal phosphate-dependent aminotransferase [Clostridia bacterium]
GVGKEKYPTLPDDHLPMWVADMDFACPQPIIDAMKARLDKRILGYSAILDPAYYQALGTWMKTRHHWNVDPTTSLFTPGIIFALRMAVQTLTAPNDSVLIQTPAYAHFKNAAELYGRTVVQNPLISNHGHYEIDWADFEQKAKDPNVTLFFLCNPHNPTGRVWTKEELTRMGEICFANNVFVISDEIHFDFIRQGITHTVFASLFPEEKRIITCTAPSKTFNLAGNQLSNIFFADHTIQELWQNTHLIGNPNPLSIDACIAAYSQCSDWVDALNLYLDENFRHFQSRINQELPYVNFNIPESTYLAWVDLSGAGYPLEELKSRITEAGLFIEYEDEFVANGQGHVRINLACPKAFVDKAVDLLVKALKC